MSALDVFQYADRKAGRDSTLLAGAEQHLYIVEYVNAGVKVGVTADPPSRLKAHERAARAHGGQVGRIALSGPHSCSKENERSLVRLGGAGNRSEYLPITFDDALKAAEALSYPRADRDAFAARTEAGFNFLKALVLRSDR
ncbi:hypothetical protein [Curtobacterium sp. MCBD17_021]|uniref:hypothetical protein n=1 Tax=Curtobacterium sp. MCBD17_021 TaxID=2175665 RepID=UPI000DAA1F4E|nr:hypothetical protein [Curtobacterium sp. MCBD17_021]PZE66939.1 hypothetical protein DEI83_06415 [Curtobacterium sp. MCBD17_021]